MRGKNAKSKKGDGVLAGDRRLDSPNVDEKERSEISIHGERFPSASAVTKLLYSAGSHGTLGFIPGGQSISWERDGVSYIGFLSRAVDIVGVTQFQKQGENARESSGVCGCIFHPNCVEHV